MSIKKKLNQELDKFCNYHWCDVVLRDTNILHLYEIYDYNSKKYCQYYYFRNLRYKENMQIFNKVLEKFFLEIGCIKVGEKYLRKSEIECIQDLLDENTINKMINIMEKLYGRMKINNKQESQLLKDMINYLKLKLKEGEINEL